MNTIDQEQLRLAWPLYFPGEQAPEGRSQDATLDLVRQFRFYFLSDACRTLLPTLSFSSEVLASGSFAVHLDYELLRREGPYLNFQNDLIDAPQRMLLAIGMALYLAYQHKMGEDWFPSFPRVHARIFNLPTVTPLRNLRTVLVGKFVSLRGTVVRCSAVKPVLLSCDFLCPKCSARQTVHSTDGRITPPTKCTTKGCRAKAMTPDRPAAVTEDWQRIRLQEVMDEERDAGRMPRSVDCELRGDLVDCCAAGDEITLTGIVRAMPSSGGGGGGMQSNMQTVYTLYIDVNSVSNTRSAAADGSLDAAQFSETDMAAIRAIQNEPQLFRLLVHSLCPSIFGHEIVKAGLVLVLFGAAQPKSGSIHSSSTTVMHVRGDPHMLVVGDPGMGKSNLLKAVSQIAPRCVYVCGNTATTTGLTVTVVKDSGSGDYSLEAGALVLADQGVCCIDEFDKMSCEHAALLEAMEQQSISIAKAGMVCNLPARTSVIAAANPVGGHYNKAKTVAENIKLPSPLLSRFDIIFILLDRPNVVHDRMLSEHVMRIHSTRRPLRQTQALDVPVTQEKHHKDVVYGKSAVGASSSSSASSLNVDSETLLTRLCLKAGERLDVIPPVLLRKYITYARRFVHPRLSPEAAEMLKLFYLSLRAKDTGDAAPITTRQLESLVRLAKARARAELREIVTVEDAQDVISIMKESFYDTVVDEFGNIDFDRPSRGGSSKAKDVTKYVAILTREAQKKGSSTFHVSELKDIAMRAQIKCASFDDFCNYLNMNNYLLKRGNGMYKLQTSGV